MKPKVAESASLYTNPASGMNTISASGRPSGNGTAGSRLQAVSRTAKKTKTKAVFDSRFIGDLFYLLEMTTKSTGQVIGSDK